MNLGFNSRAFNNLNIQWPEFDVNEIKIEAVVEPFDLGKIIYVLLAQAVIRPDFEFDVELEFIENYIAPEFPSLNKTDLYAFLIATTIEAKRKVEKKYQAKRRFGNYWPKMLPYINMMKDVSTNFQSDWWAAAYKVKYEKEYDSNGKLIKLIKLKLKCIDYAKRVII